MRTAYVVLQIRKPRVSPSREPIFNLPRVVMLLALVLAAIHGVRALLLDPETDLQVLLWLAFVPARYGSELLIDVQLPGGIAAGIWTFVTYAFLHGDVWHLGINLVWLAAFGSPLAWRFGTARFLAFSAVTAAAGALAHLATHVGEFVPVIGASAAISGAMAAATRFAFEEGGPLGGFRRHGPDAFKVPAAPLSRALRNPQVLAFLGVWFFLNLMFGATAFAAGVADATVAWQAHVGGFLAGLLLFPLFDPVRAPPS
jgi:membrane associated rhomboid family serine protease